MDLSHLSGGAMPPMVPDLAKRAALERMRVIAMIERGGIYTFHLVGGEQVTGCVIGAAYTPVHQDKEKAIMMPTVAEVQRMHLDAAGKWQKGSHQGAGDDEPRIGIAFMHVTHWTVWYDPGDQVGQVPAPQAQTQDAPPVAEGNKEDFQDAT